MKLYFLNVIYKHSFILEGIELIAYQRFGTLNRSFHRKSRSESDPSLCSLTNDDNKLGLHYKNK